MFTGSYDKSVAAVDVRMIGSGAVARHGVHSAGVTQVSEVGSAVVSGSMRGELAKWEWEDDSVVFCAVPADERAVRGGWGDGGAAEAAGGGQVLYPYAFAPLADAQVAVCSTPGSALQVRSLETGLTAWTLDPGGSGERPTLAAATDGVLVAVGSQFVTVYDVDEMVRLSLADSGRGEP